MKHLTFLISLHCSLTAFSQQQWQITEDYTIAFSGTKAEGTFRGLEGEIRFDPSNLGASTFDVSVDVGTIATGNKTKDKHARGDSWFDAVSFPKILFTSDRISRKNNNEFDAIGTLQLKGISKEMTISFTFSEEGNTGLFTGRMEVSREDFGIEGNFFGFVVGDDFVVDLKVPVVRTDGG